MYENWAGTLLFEIVSVVIGMRVIAFLVNLVGLFGHPPLPYAENDSWAMWIYGRVGNIDELNDAIRARDRDAALLRRRRR